MDNESKLFLDLESVEKPLSDPEFDGMLSDVRVFNEDLFEDPSKSGQALHAVKELNEEIRNRHFLRAPLRVTGDAYRGDVDPEVYDQEFQFAAKRRREMKYRRMQLLGFAVLQHPKTLDEYGVRERAEVVMRAQTAANDFSYTRYIVPLSQQTEVQFKKETAARMGAWLEVYHPEAKEELDSVLLESGTEMAALEGLRDMYLSTEGMKKHEVSRLQHHVEAYLADMVQYEHVRPYVVDFVGTYTAHNVMNNTDEDKQLFQNNVDVTIDHLNIYHDKETRRLKPLLFGHMLDNTKTGDTLVYVPLESLSNIRAWRDIKNHQK